MTDQAYQETIDKLDQHLFGTSAQNILNGKPVRHGNIWSCAGDRYFHYNKHCPGVGAKRREKITYRTARILGLTCCSICAPRLAEIPEALKVKEGKLQALKRGATPF